MFDLLQKRNLVLAKNLYKGEEISLELADLSLSSEMKHLCLDNIMLLTQYIQNLSPFGDSSLDTQKPTDGFLDNLERWVEASLQAEPKSKSETTATTTTTSVPRRPSIVIKSETKLPLASMAAIEPNAIESLQESPNQTPKSGYKKRTERPIRPTPVILRVTRARVEPTKQVATFEHTDNSCCENGPVDEHELMETIRVADRLLGDTLVKEETDEDNDEPLYMVNEFDDSGIVLQEFNSPSKVSDLRSRLRSRKRVS